MPPKKLVVSSWESVVRIATLLIKQTKFRVLFLVVLFFLLATIYQLQSTIKADEIEDLQKQIDALNQARSQSVAATKPLEGQLSSLQSQLAQIQGSLKALGLKITQKEQDLDVRTEKLAVQQALLETRVRSYYIKSFLTSPLVIIFSSGSSGDLLKDLSYRLATTREDQKVITSVTKEVVALITEKEQLEKDKLAMASLQAQVDKNATFLNGEISKAKSYQSTLSSQIAQLNARQQQIIASRQSSLNLPTSLGAGPLYCTDDRKLDPGFSPAFAFFTFGIPHRVGLNQYGALGRAQSGQNYRDILNAYFQNISFESKGNPNIKVQGFGEMSLEQYMLGVYEVPSSWPLEALKAQAVAVRSYALAYTYNGEKEICTTQSCQVYKGGNKGGGWEEAVRATEGEVMTSGGSPISAWFSSTDGGYTFTSGDVGWSNRSYTKRTRDTSGDISSFSDLFSKAYDKDSPCFYAAQGYRNEYGKSAWLKSSEVADLVNVVNLVKRDGGTADHLYQPDKPNPAGTDTWDPERVKQELRNRGGTPLNSVSSVSVNADFGSGQATSINFSGDSGSFSFNAPEFKNYFNLRAPANISIVGPLFNVEKK